MSLFSSQYLFYLSSQELAFGFIGFLITSFFAYFGFNLLLCLVLILRWIFRLLIWNFFLLCLVLYSPSNHCFNCILQIFKDCSDSNELLETRQYNSGPYKCRLCPWNTIIPWILFSSASICKFFSVLLI